MPDTPPHRSRRQDPSRRQAFGFGAAAAATLAGASPATAAAAPPSFTLVLVNDIYRMGEHEGRGGFARLAAIVRGERARGVPTLVCHAGDTFSPSLMSGFDQGAHIVELTNLVRPDLFVPGNHEFDFGPAIFAKRLAEANFPCLAANMQATDGGPVPGVGTSVIRDLGGVRVGVVGLALRETPLKSQTGDLRFLPELPVLEAETTRLRAAGAQFLVALAHTDRETDEAIVRSRLVDVLLSGHDHDLWLAWDGRTVAVESNEEGYFVTAVDITVRPSESGSLAWSPSFRVIDSRDVEPDPAVHAVVRRLEGDLSRELDVPLGVTQGPLDSRPTAVRAEEAALGDIAADAVRASTEAEVALLNGGGFRGNRVYPAETTLTRRDVLTELPFGNTTVLVELTGAQLRGALEHGFALIERRSGRFPQISGLTVTVDRAAPAGARVRNVRVGEADLDPARRYRVAANSFMLGGGDGYGMLGEGRVLIGLTDGKIVANEVMAHIRRLGTLPPFAGGRIVFA